MPEDRADRAPSEAATRPAGPAIPAALLAALAIALLTAAGTGARYWFRGDFGAVHALLVLFFSINLWICYWEICLFLRRDYVERRVAYWRGRQRETGRKPVIDFLTSKVPLAKVLSPTVWADVWAAYAEIDESFADRRAHGYNVDIANGFVTPVPILVLYAAYTFGILPAPAAGIIGAMLFWQLWYATLVYWIGFFGAGRQSRIGRKDRYIYIWAPNTPWVLFSLLGLYVSIRLIVDGDYGVLGY
ncbi:MAG: hypothetical protein F4114_00590 [Rhodospirillaceae bacterium]|nr:hypothetical protein [Rhodospirillaceae bacterium]MYB14997.1 hypothetical protein [Rhodospirillaceae bacterium]MYI47564.1 hypothetical protein [Rhodospirillaceae bacterium]